MADSYIIVGDVHSANASTLQEIHHRLLDLNSEDIPTKAIFLGDLVDRGWELPEVQKNIWNMFQDGLIETICVGNHDWKMWKALTAYSKVQLSEDATRTMKEFTDHPLLADRYVTLINELGTLVYKKNHHYFVHGGLPRNIPDRTYSFIEFLKNKKSLHSWLSPCFFNHTITDRTATFPIRDMSWIHSIPSGLIVWKGHDYMYEQPTMTVSESGAAVVYVDTGSGFPDCGLGHFHMSENDDIMSLSKRINCV